MSAITSKAIAVLALLLNVPVIFPRTHAFLSYSIQVMICSLLNERIAPPFWTVLSERRPFVSKGCTTKMDCENQKEFFRNRCFVSGQRDWTCADCCYTDNCNYLVEVSLYACETHATYKTKPNFLFLEPIFAVVRAVPNPNFTITITFYIMRVNSCSSLWIQLYCFVSKRTLDTCIGHQLQMLRHFVL